ncbi:hypothetical protein J4456_01130 [Candidatus Pacearchaeota archaeon]|nr:hypothetical protein [Candidatus Pacearchaeota archaeon]
MVNSFGLHKRRPDNHRKLKKFFDKFVIAFLIPLAHTFHLLKIWPYRDASKISKISWSSFIVFSLFWPVYGIIHKEKLIIIMYVFLFVIQAIIVLGGFLYG